jgi:hypothetical protein
MPSPDTIVVLGIRPADTVLLLVTGATVLAQPLHVAPPLTLSGTALGTASPVGFVDLTYQAWTQTFSAEVHRPGLDAIVGAGGWQMHFISGTLTVAGGSALATPLQAFGIGGGGWGASVRTVDGWEVVASGAQSQVVHHWPLGAGDEVALAGTLVGPLGTLHLERGGWGVDLAALYRDGAAQWAGVLTTNIGPVVVAYASGPQGSGLSAQFNQNGWTFSAAQGPQGPQVGLGATVAAGSRMNLWWTAQGGYGLGMTLPLGDFSPLTISLNSGNVFASASTLEAPGMVGTTTTGFGTGLLTVTGPPPGYSVTATPAAATALRLWSPPPLATGLPAPITPDLVHTRIEIPAGPAAALRSPTPVAGAAPVSIPTGSSALIVHVCLHSASPKTTCDPTDPIVVVRLYVDDRPGELTGVALPIAPGPHTVSIHPEDLPPFLVPLGPLACPIDLTAGGIGVCDFAFRRAGTP